MKKRALIVGATGFGGLGLIELILRHPELEISQLVARKDTGVPISDVFPHLKGYCDMLVEDNEAIRYENVDIAFFSTPDRAGMTLIQEFHKRGIKVIDFSGDFRFNSLEDYAVYAKGKGMETDHSAEEILLKSVYGLPELNRDLIAKAQVVGNPGCFAICMILGMLPLAKAGIIKSDTILCDGKSGVSGAGKNPGSANFYPQRYEDVNTYREGHHQHQVEVENTVNKVGKDKKKVLFIPQVVPMTRGILNNIYVTPTEPVTSAQLRDIYNEFYKSAPFVKITEKSPHTTDVRGSNRCLIRPMYDERTNTILVTSVIDNLLKGQSGNAIQNANIMLGLPETMGLELPGFYP